MGSISGSTIRADFAIRGFAISSLISLRVAFSASLLEFLLTMIDDCTFLERRTVNSGHASIFKILGQMQLASSSRCSRQLRALRLCPISGISDLGNSPGGGSQ